jgi:hypothetical protein
MSKIAEMLNKIECWCKENRKDQYKPLKSGLTKAEIDSILGTWEFQLPKEIIELYKWGNGSIHNSFLPYPNGDYGIQKFYSLSNALGESHDFNQHFDDLKKDEFLLLLFGAEGCYTWTVLKKKPTKLARIYSNDEPVMDSPDYRSLAAMLESMMKN